MDVKDFQMARDAAARMIDEPGDGLPNDSVTNGGFTDEMIHLADLNRLEADRVKLQASGEAGNAEDLQKAQDITNFLALTTEEMDRFKETAQIAQALKKRAGKPLTSDIDGHTDLEWRAALTMEDSDRDELLKEAKNNTTIQRIMSQPYQGLQTATEKNNAAQETAKADRDEINKIKPPKLVEKEPKDTISGGTPRSLDMPGQQVNIDSHYGKKQITSPRGETTWVDKEMASDAVGSVGGLKPIDPNNRATGPLGPVPTTKPAEDKPGNGFWGAPAPTRMSPDAVGVIPKDTLKPRDPDNRATGPLGPVPTTKPAEDKPGNGFWGAPAPTRMSPDAVGVIPKDTLKPRDPDNRATGPLGPVPATTTGGSLKGLTAILPDNHWWEPDVLTGKGILPKDLERPKVTKPSASGESSSNEQSHTGQQFVPTGRGGPRLVDDSNSSSALDTQSYGGGGMFGRNATVRQINPIAPTTTNRSTDNSSITGSVVPGAFDPKMGAAPSEHIGAGFDTNNGPGGTSMSTAPLVVIPDVQTPPTSSFNFPPDPDLGGASALITPVVVTPTTPAPGGSPGGAYGSGAPGSSSPQPAAVPRPRPTARPSGGSRSMQYM